MKEILRYEAGVDSYLRERGRELCRMILDREPLHELSNVAIVTAHADDETIGYGSVIAQIPDALAIQVTDCAPKVPVSTRHFSTAEEFKDYIREVRHAELHAALDVTGHNSERRVCLGIPDQDVANNISKITAELVEYFEKNNITFVLTHSYEGGHPDHDAVAASVHIARELLHKKGIHIEIIEAPIYKGEWENPKGRVWQDFSSGVSTVPENIFVKMLSPEEIELKKKLYAVYESQAHVFENTYVDRELFRIAPDYDFMLVPNGGHLTDIFLEFGLTHEKWQELICDARTALGLSAPAFAVPFSYPS